MDERGWGTGRDWADGQWDGTRTNRTGTGQKLDGKGMAPGTERDRDWDQDRNQNPGGRGLKRKRKYEWSGTFPRTSRKRKMSNQTKRNQKIKMERVILERHKPKRTICLDTGDDTRWTDQNTELDSERSFSKRDLPSMHSASVNDSGQPPLPTATTANVSTAGVPTVA